MESSILKKKYVLLGLFYFGTCFNESDVESDCQCIMIY